MEKNPMSPHKELFESLKAPFAAEQLSWRVGSLDPSGAKGKALPYIDARDVQSRLDEILGPPNWKNRYIEVFAGQRLMAVRCTLSARIEGEWVDKEDAAYLPATHRDDASLERAVKGVYSDALKRAAVQWGVGRYLYAFNAPWVDLVDGKLSRIPSLEESVDKHAVPEQVAVPANPVKTESEPKAAATLVKENGTQSASAAEQAPLVDESKYMPEQAAAPAPAPAPASAPAAAPAASAPAPAATSATAPSSTFLEIKQKLDNKTVPANMLRTYIQGPKGKEKLSAAERETLLKAIEEATPA
jgi:hypothetical protein